MKGQLISSFIAIAISLTVVPMSFATSSVPNLATCLGDCTVQEGVCLQGDGEVWANQMACYNTRAKCVTKCNSEYPKG